ncbi:hypothetical protein D1817_02885 [Flavobacteriaceae bacterium]|nr:hypothetical protein D1817_02885 [Flavobacteriaceae bacterium]
MKNSFKKYIGILILTVILTSCGGGGSDDGPPPPPPNTAPPTVAVNQVNFPTPNLLCIDNNIAFDWDDVVDPDGDNVSYRIIIARDRDLTQVEENRIVTSSNVTIMLEIATAFYWTITTIDSRGEESEPSDTLAFFTMGEGTVNNAPFTAAIVSPEDQGNVASGTVALTWDGADTDVGDTLTYELFFGTTSDPASFQTGLTAETFDVSTDPATTYYWRIDTTDDSGAKSIGRVWQFTTN